MARIGGGITRSRSGPAAVSEVADDGCCNPTRLFGLILSLREWLLPQSHVILHQPGNVAMTVRIAGGLPSASTEQV
jgi:hypothetical protein